MMRKIYKESYLYDPETKEFLGMMAAWASPLDLEQGRLIFLQPANSTFIKPAECTKNEVSVWDGERWVVKADLRKEDFYNIKTKELTKLDIGVKPDLSKIADKPPFSEADQWDGEKWESPPVASSINVKVEWDPKNKKWIEIPRPITGLELANLIQQNLPTSIQIFKITNTYLFYLSNLKTLTMLDSDNTLTELYKDLESALKQKEIQKFKATVENLLSKRVFES